MPLVGTVSETCHRFAQDTGEPYRVSGRRPSLFAEGPVLYSYGRHFPIAGFSTSPCGERLVLFNARTYSNTTGRHQSATLDAFRGKTHETGSFRGHAVRVVRVPLPERWHPEGNRPGSTDFAGLESEATRDWFDTQIGEAYSKAKRARTRSDMYLRDAERLERDRETLNQCYDLGWSEPRDLGEIRAEAEARAKAQEIDARQAEAARGAARLEEFAERVGIPTCGGDVLKRAGVVVPRLLDSWRLGNLSAWDAGSIIGSARAVWECASRILPADSEPPVGDILRVMGDRLQTSRGASVVINDKSHRRIALAWGLLRRGADGAAVVARSRRAIMLGQFSVTEIDPKARTISVGCHRFAEDECQRIATSLGIDVEEADELAAHYCNAGGRVSDRLI